MPKLPSGRSMTRRPRPKRLLAAGQRLSTPKVSNPTGVWGGKILRRPLGWGVKGSVKRNELALYAKNIRRTIGVDGPNRWMTSRGASGATWIRGQWQHQRLKMARSPHKRMLAKAHRSLTQRTAAQRRQSAINGRKGAARLRRR